MNSIKFKPTLPEILGEVCAFIIIVVFLGWALASFFPLTWQQAFIISWMFNKLLDVLRYIGK